jgi:hypothetical protein
VLLGQEHLELFEQFHMLVCWKRSLRPISVAIERLTELPLERKIARLGAILGLLRDAIFHLCASQVTFDRAPPRSSGSAEVYFRAGRARPMPRTVLTTPLAKAPSYRLAAIDWLAADVAASSMSLAVSFA